MRAGKPQSSIPFVPNACPVDAIETLARHRPKSAMPKPGSAALLVVSAYCGGRRNDAYRRPLPSTSAVTDALSESRSPLSIRSLSLTRSLIVSTGSRLWLGRAHRRCRCRRYCRRPPFTLSSFSPAVVAWLAGLGFENPPSYAFSLRK